MITDAGPVLAAISMGALDDDLEELAAQIKQRQLSTPLKVGDKIVVSDNVAPKYMSGIHGTVKSVTGKRQRGNMVYLIKVDDVDAPRLYGTKMWRYTTADGPKVADITMARDLIKKV